MAAGWSTCWSERNEQEVAERATHWQSWELSKRQLCDLELLSGAFSPLQGFLGRILRRLTNDGYLAAMPDGFTGTEGPEHRSVMA